MRVLNLIASTTVRQRIEIKETGVSLRVNPFSSHHIPVPCPQRKTTTVNEEADSEV